MPTKKRRAQSNQASGKSLRHSNPSIVVSHACLSRSFPRCGSNTSPISGTPPARVAPCGRRCNRQLLFRQILPPVKVQKGIMLKIVIFCSKEALTRPRTWSSYPLYTKTKCNVRRQGSTLWPSFVLLTRPLNSGNRAISQGTSYGLCFHGIHHPVHIHTPRPWDSASGGTSLVLPKSMLGAPGQLFFEVRRA